MSMKPCRECKTEVSTEAPTCPKCGAKNPTNKTGWVVPIIIAVVIFVVWSGISGAGNKSNESQSSAKVEEPKAPPMEVSNTQLYADYKANEVAADEKYKGKRLLVSGIVESIDKDALDNIVVQLQGPNMFSHTSARIEDAQKATAAALTKGNKIKVLCEKVSKIIGSPNLRDCVIQ